MKHNVKLAEFSSNSILPSDDRRPSHSTYSHSQESGRTATWGAFQAGMHVLQKYAGRSPANPESIAKANLQLLHRALLKDPSYVQALQNAYSGAATHDLPTSHCIFSNQILRADFLTMKSGSSIQLKSNVKKCSMYLSIAGKPSIQTANNPLVNKKRWWNQRVMPQHPQLLKNGDSVIMPAGCKGEKKLFADNQECIFLRIQLAS